MEHKRPEISSEETTVQAERAIKAEVWRMLIENKRQVWTVAVPLFYLAGFLVLNANLTKFGITEFDIISAKYLPAAGNFLFFLLCYGLFAGRLVVSIHDWITSSSRRVERNGLAGWPWKAVVAIRSFALPTFLICFAASLYSGTALQQARVDAFYLALGLAFALSYMLETCRFSLKYPRANELIDLLIDVVGIAAFFALGESDVQRVFWIYLGVSIYINFTLDIVSRRKRDKDLYAFFVLNSIIGVLTLSLVFGSSVYDKVAQRLGGGGFQSVRLSVDDKVREALPVIRGGQAEAWLDGKLLYQTDKYIFIDFDGRTIRMRNDDVRLLDVERHTSSPTQVSGPHN